MKTFLLMVFAVPAFVFGGVPFARPATAGDACPAGYFQKGMEKSGDRKPHCTRSRSTRDTLRHDKAAQESAKPARDPGYTYCLLLHPGGEDC